MAFGHRAFAFLGSVQVVRLADVLGNIMAVKALVVFHHHGQELFDTMRNLWRQFDP